MKVYRKVGQSKFIKEGYEGLLTIHDSGKIAGSIDRKELFNETIYEMDAGCRSITKPTAKDMNALFDFNE